MTELSTFQKLAISTVLATLFLIFVGGLVRASGAGLGCPDWPKCFDMWIPPTSADQLPAGFDESQFNVVKTWTEYINRLIGVVIGLLITATFIRSFRFRSEKPAVFWSAALAFVGVLFQGWLGGQVVRTGLSEWLITIHMITALIIVNLLLYATFKASVDHLSVTIPGDISNKLIWINGGLLLLTLVQIGMGTQVREMVDYLANRSVYERGEWIAQIGLLDEAHRSFSWLVFILAGLNLYVIRKRINHSLFRKLAYATLGLVVLQMVLGAGLVYLGMPPAFQVFHLTFAAFLICGEFLMLLTVHLSKTKGLADRKPAL